MLPFSPRFLGATRARSLLFVHSFRKLFPFHIEVTTKKIQTKLATCNKNEQQQDGKNNAEL
jgi:hypothetical protein